MVLILWASSGLAAMASAVRLTEGDAAMAAGLLVLAMLTGPVGYAIVRSGPAGHDDR
jgi:hypothetical protein